MSKNNSLSYYAILSIIFLISSCTYNSEEDLYPPEPVEDDISYLNDVLPIIETNCYACHDAVSMNGGINLEGYDNLVIRVEDGSLEGTIRHEENWLAMPLAASKLPDNLIQQISDWIDQGYPNN
ncbi:MAG: hypothetical protein AAGA77_13785 [Bacteroidota bacterium]